MNFASPSTFQGCPVSNTQEANDAWVRGVRTIAAAKQIEVAAVANAKQIDLVEGAKIAAEKQRADILRSLPADLAAPEVIERVLGAVREFTADAEPIDDMTVMVLRVLEPAAG